MPWSDGHPTRFLPASCWRRSPLSKPRCARGPLAVEPPAEPRALAALLGPDHSHALAGPALVPQVRNGALERPRAAPAVDHVAAAMVDEIVPIGQRMTDIAHRQRLGLLRFQHFSYENIHQINTAAAAGIAKTRRKIRNSSATE